jgi:hypothetical protein
LRTSAGFRTKPRFSKARDHGLIVKATNSLGNMAHVLKKAEGYAAANSAIDGKFPLIAV